MSDEDDEIYDDDGIDDDAEEFDDDDPWIIDMPDEIHYLDFDYANFIDTDPNKSFMGWLLTLNEEEFNIIDEYVNENEEDQYYIFPLIYHFKKIPLSGEHISDKDYVEITNKICLFVTMISLYKKKMITINTKGKDEDWTFGLTSEGLESVENMNLNKLK